MSHKNEFRVKIDRAIFDERISSSLYCKVCDFYDEKDITAHLKSSDHAQRVSTLAYRKTLVFWDINNCPVPDDVDAGLVVPGIKRLLETSGFAGGPLTITAIGDLECILKQSPHVLPAISSSGVRLRHSEEEPSHLYEWTMLNPPPATIMLICGRDNEENYSDFTRILRGNGYTIFHYPSMEFLRRRELCSEMNMPSAFRCETGEPAWCCILCGLNHELFPAKRLPCESIQGESIEDFTKHLESTFHKRNVLDTFGTQVWWDINSCLVSDDLDASQVVPSIKRLLEKSDISAGPLTITAMGDLEPILKQTPDVLAAISSAGVLLKHVPKGRDLWNELVSWTLEVDLDDPNPPPADRVLISSRPDLGCIHYLQDI